MFGFLPKINSSFEQKSQNMWAHMHFFLHNQAITQNIIYIWKCIIKLKQCKVYLKHMWIEFASDIVKEHGFSLKSGFKKILWPQNMVLVWNLDSLKYCTKTKFKA